MDEDDIGNMIMKAIMNGSSNAKDKNKKIGRDKGIELLNKFKEGFDSSNFSVGDIVERNEFGKKKYKFPDDGMPAMVIKNFDPVIIDNDGNVCDIMVAVVRTDGAVMAFPICGAFYQKAKKKENVTPLFGKRL